MALKAADDNDRRDEYIEPMQKHSRSNDTNGGGVCEQDVKHCNKRHYRKSYQEHGHHKEMDSDNRDGDKKYFEIFLRTCLSDSPDRFLNRIENGQLMIFLQIFFRPIPQK